MWWWSSWEHSSLANLPARLCHLRSRSNRVKRTRLDRMVAPDLDRSQCLERNLRWYNFVKFQFAYFLEHKVATNYLKSGFASVRYATQKKHWIKAFSSLVHWGDCANIVCRELFVVAVTLSADRRNWFIARPALRLNINKFAISTSIEFEPKSQFHINFEAIVQNVKGNQNDHKSLKEFFFWLVDVPTEIGFIGKIYACETCWRHEQQLMTLTAWILIGTVGAVFFAVAEETTLNAVSVATRQEAILTERLVGYQQWLHFALLVLDFAILYSLLPVASLFLDVEEESGGTTDRL